MTSKKKSKDKTDSQLDMPKISNFLLYIYRTSMKLFWIFFIGTGSLLLSIIIFPILKIFIHPQDRFRHAGQRVISAGFRFFMFLLHVTCVTKIRTDFKKEFRNFHSKIIVANHPSILDTVVLISLIPNATVIASQKYEKGILGGVIKACYIINSLDFDELCKRCRECIELGSNVIIFPEGTRTPRNGKNRFKKGAARIAKKLGINIVPVFIGGSDKFGLQKNNPIWSYNPVETYLYHLIILDEIQISNYEDLPDPISAKRVTQLYEKEIRDAAEEYKKNHPWTKTVNNV